jgi:sec-independent protein translocase protein TatA
LTWVFGCTKVFCEQWKLAERIPNPANLKEAKMGVPAPTELLLILGIVLLLFGGKRIPEIMGDIGQGIRTFKKSLDSEDPQPAKEHLPPQQLPPQETKPVEAVGGAGKIEVK